MSVPRGPVRLGSARRLLAEGASQTLSNILFAVSAVVITAPLAREASATTAAAVFAAYSVESLLVTAARNYTLLSVIYRHQPPNSVCQADVLRFMRVLTLISLPGVVLMGTVCFILRPSGWLALSAGAWCAGMLIADIARHCLAVFGKPLQSLLIVSIFAGAVGVTSLFLARYPVGFLATVSAICAALAAIALATLYRQASPRPCDFGDREAKFAQGLAVEGATSIAAVTAAQVLLARLSPSELVGYQVAIQVAISPGLLLMSGLTAPLIRQIRERHASGRSDLPLICGWVGAIFFGLAIFAVAAQAGSPILQRLYGDAWGSALSLLVPLLVLQGVTTSIFAILTRYRGFISPAQVRLTWIAVVAAGNVPQVAWLAASGPGHLDRGILMSAALAATVAALVILRWEGQRNSSRETSN